LRTSAGSRSLATEIHRFGGDQSRDADSCQGRHHSDEYERKGHATEAEAAAMCFYHARKGAAERVRKSGGRAKEILRTVAGERGLSEDV